MRTEVVSFFIFSKSFQTKKIKALRPKATKIASGGPAGWVGANAVSLYFKESKISKQG